MARAEYTIEPRSHSLGLNQRVFRVNGDGSELIFDNNIRRFNIQNVFPHDNLLLIIGYRAYAGSAPSKVMALVSFDEGESFNGPYDFGHSTSPKNRSFVQVYENIILSVTDTGEGISSENIKNLFQAFFTTKKDGNGTGLGLSICRQIINDHDGILEVKSELGIGATFSIILPKAKKQLNAA